MMRFALPPLVLGIAACCVFAQPAPIDLKGKTLSETFQELLPGMSSADNGARGSAQQRWQDICFAVSAPGQEKLRAEACLLMAARLDEKTPSLARLWLLQQLQRIAHEESLEALAAVLQDKDAEIRDAAVRALANNPSPKATERLTAALSKANERTKIGILNSLGQRGDPAAVAALEKELSVDEPVAIAAARALGRIPAENSLPVLSAARKSARPPVRNAIDHALLAQADQLLKKKKTSEAAAIYESLNHGDSPQAVRLAALRGIIESKGDKAGEVILDTLKSDDDKARAVAVGQIENLSAGALKTLAASMDKLSVPSRVSVITAIAARGDRSQLAIALAAARSQEAEVKRAGLLALGRLGDASTVEFLLETMSARDALAGIAAESLAALPAEGVNEKLAAVLDAEKAAARKISLIGILERRKATSAVNAVLKTASDTDSGVRTAAFAALKVLANPKHLREMVAAFLKTTKGNERDLAEQAIVAVAAQLPTPEKRAEPVFLVLKDAGPNRLVDALPLLGRLGGQEARKAIREAIAATDPALHDAGVAGLCLWPDVSANEDLLRLAEQGKSDAEKQRAVQALIRVNAVLLERTPEERLAALAAMKATMPLAMREQERRSLLENVGFIRHIETLHFVLPYLDQPALAQSACKAVVELAHSKMLREPNKAEFDKALDRVIAMCKDKGLVERARQYKEGR